MGSCGAPTGIYWPGDLLLTHWGLAECTPGDTSPIVLEASAPGYAAVSSSAWDGAAASFYNRAFRFRLNESAPSARDSARTHLSFLLMQLKRDMQSRAHSA